MQKISTEASRAKFAFYLTLPILIIGLINEPIFRSLNGHLFFQFLIDALNKAIVPVAMCWYLLNRKIISHKELGIGAIDVRQFIEDCLVCIPALSILWGVQQKFLWPILWPYDWILHSHLFSYLQMFPRDVIGHLFTAFYMAITAGVTEELYFRGVWKFSVFALIQDKQIAKWVFILVSSLMFGLIHWKSGLTNMVGAFFFGLMAARLYLWTNSLWPLMTAHFMIDMVIFM